MPRFYLTFGQAHVHQVNGRTWDHDVICAIEAPDMAAARATAFATFRSKWAFLYTEEDLQRIVEYYPNGVQPLEQA